MDVPHAGARGPRGQDDRVHADRDRRRDVRHHGISPRRGPGRGDRQGTLAVRSPQGLSVPAPAGIRRGQPGLRPLVRRPARRRSSHHPRHFGWTIVLAGREDRPARPEVRQGWRRQSPREARSQGRGALLWTDVGPGRLERHDRRRGLLRRGARHRRAGGHPRVRRPDGSGGLAVPDRPPSGRVRPRDLGGRFLEGPRRRQRLGRVQRRRGSRDGLRRARIGDRRLLRRRPSRGEPLRQLHGRARRQDGPADLAFPDLASRPVGPRPAGLSQPRHGHPRRQADRRRRAGDEDGLRVPVRPRDGQAALRRRGVRGAGLRRPGRAGLADPAVPGQAAADLRPVTR